MAKLYFYYAAMNAGKTTMLLQSSYNYQEKGMYTIIYTADIDNRFTYGKVWSRIGISANALVFNNQTNLFSSISSIHKNQLINCVLIDECHFLCRKQVIELTKIVDILNIPVLCYGLRTDFRARLFSGSLYLLAWADKLIELKTICYCGHQANMVLRIDDNGCVLHDGSQILIGNNDRYLSVCRKHFMEKFKIK